MKSIIALVAITCCYAAAMADPCGMVPPIYTGDGAPITRIGEQRTFVFFQDGIETIAIHPGFEGKVDEFGMLIPFPTPPAIRKLPDDIFPHIAAAIDPPEVVIDLRPVVEDLSAALAPAGGGFGGGGLHVSNEDVRVLREEAVGMYEVAVLEAGSPAALQRWMDEHGYRYPRGMDKVCHEYVQQRWCFVAVKTRVAGKSGAGPRPGQRQTNPQLPVGGSFDGHVQAMGFRFQSEKLVVPMRLSAFNAGELRNIVYLLTAGPKRIRSIPEEYVVRQISGNRLYFNLTDPLPLRIIGGSKKDLRPYHLANLKKRRDPHPKNGAAKNLFAADLAAVASGKLALADEEEEKELLQIGEHLGLRGREIDRLNAEALAAARESTVRHSLANLQNMTLTVLDGDFPRDVVANQNLTFTAYKMPTETNNATEYDARRMGPGQRKRAGNVIYGDVSLVQPAHPAQPYRSPWLVMLLLGLVFVGGRCIAKSQRN